MNRKLKFIAEDTINHIWKNLESETDNIVKLSKYYSDGKIKFDAVEKYPYVTISVEKMTSNDAIQKYSNIDCCVLNFASAKNPGGGFLNGAFAQEEALARSSNLYPTLIEHMKFYENPPAPYYTDKVIYSPNVIFFKNDYGEYISNIKCSVITSAAPNLNSHGWDLETLKLKFLERIEKVFQIAILNDEECLILGAWGCGVFKNPPEMVAEQFEIMVKKYSKYFSRIVFAIPDDKNFDVFNKVIT